MKQKLNFFKALRYASLLVVVLLGLAAIIGTGGSDSGSKKGSEGDAGGDKSNSLGMAFVYIEPGTFHRGSPVSELGRRDEEDLHQVTLTRGFYMQITPVTQKQWEAVMGYNPSYFDRCGEKCPVESISWHDAKEFIDSLNRMGEGTYRLPTEAEWEYSARAGSTMAFAGGPIAEAGCGDNPHLDEMGWYCGNSGVDYNGCMDITTWGGFQCAGPHPVARKMPNAWGLYDMHGNVWEWVEDYYGDYPKSAVVDPSGPLTGSTRVLRGGSWFDYARSNRSASRYSNMPDYRYQHTGFRLVMEQSK